ncbi:hypothetical protein RM780_22290 [Streptomyces sp. DSM 44917]|uniref:Uncharacterized protein n=1 Tax=Streptomyces boetiae TaxID=3075541 RepID=A0ABU2LDL1_9ACTN|nr:hypothetical protein [Streptomyces sp. DSM 44917]MDT0309665.1 hypothetical protein [Streptomyces sp. DSM 44917]
MTNNKKPEEPMNPMEQLLRTSVLILATVIALNLAVVLLRPILPWVITGGALAAVIWLTVTVERWRRSKW